RALLRELGLGQRGVQVELLVEPHGGGEVGIAGHVLDGHRGGRGRFLGGGDGGSGADEQGGGQREFHRSTVAEGSAGREKREKRKWPVPGCRCKVASCL